jgi:hypothetical protein
MAPPLPCESSAGKKISEGPCINGKKTVEYLDADCSTYFVDEPCGPISDPCEGEIRRFAWRDNCDNYYVTDGCGNFLRYEKDNCLPQTPPPTFIAPPPTFTTKPPPTFIAPPPSFTTTPPPSFTPPPIAPPPSFSPPPVAPPPSFSPPPLPPPKPPVVKTSTPDIIQFNDDTVPADIIADLLFENVGGQELLTISRYDTVNGQSVLYQPIKNLDLLQQQYNPNNLVKLQETSDVIFANYPIQLENKIPDVGSGANLTNMYIDSLGSLVIEFVGIRPDELVEVQISYSGTIYEVGI